MPADYGGFFSINTMKSFQTLYENAQLRANDQSSATLTFLKEEINTGLHIIEDELGSFYTEQTRTDLTEANVDSYPTPENFVRAVHVEVVVGTVHHQLTVVHDEDLWKRMKSYPSTSTYPTHVFFRNNSYEFFPTPDTAGYTINLRYEASNVDLVADDYTTGTIYTATNGSKSITGASSPAWTSVLEGRFIRLDSGDRWYEIESVDSATTLTLKSDYSNPSVVAGAESYTIGQMPRIPASIHNLPVYFAMSQYFSGPREDDSKSKDYMRQFLGTGEYAGTGLIAAKARWARRSSSRVIKGSRRMRLGLGRINPNFFGQEIS